MIYHLHSNLTCTFFYNTTLQSNGPPIVLWVCPAFYYILQFKTSARITENYSKYFCKILFFDYFTLCLVFQREFNLDPTPLKYDIVIQARQRQKHNIPLVKHRPE